MNVRNVGFWPIVGRGGVTVSVTGTCCAGFVDPEAVRVIIAVYVFSRSPAAFTLTLIVSVSVVVVPEVGFRLSHEALSLTLQLSVPPPVLVMLNVWAAGFAPPSGRVNVRVPGSERLVGGGDGSVWPGGDCLSFLTLSNNRSTKPFNPPPLGVSPA